MLDPLDRPRRLPAHVMMPPHRARSASLKDSISLVRPLDKSAIRRQIATWYFNYRSSMIARRMVIAPTTVVEVEPFPSRAAAVWSDEERGAFIDFIAQNPFAGRIIPGTGGVRKVRWSRAGLGKRGGARIIYYFYNLDRPIYLLTAYAEARQRDLTPGQKRDHHLNCRGDSSGMDQIGRSERTVSAQAEDEEIDIGQDIIRGLRNVLAHVRGDPGNSRQQVVLVPVVDVKVARQKLQMSQNELAQVLRVSPATVRSWEHGDRQPEGAARVLLRVIEREPDAVLRALRD